MWRPWHGRRGRSTPLRPPGPEAGPLGPDVGAEPDRPGPHALDCEHFLAPGILGEARTNHVLAIGIDHHERVVAVTLTDRPGEHDEALLGERVHERGVLIPADLLAPGPRMIPGRALTTFYEEVVQSG